MDGPGHLGPVLCLVLLVVYGGVCLLCHEQGLKHTGFSDPLVSCWKLKIVEARYHVAPVKTGLQTELTHSVYSFSICPG